MKQAHEALETFESVTEVMLSTLPKPKSVRNL